jgi:aromatase
VTAVPSRTENSIVIDAPLDLVWEMTNDLDEWTGFFPKYAEVEVLEREGDTVRFRITKFPDDQGRVWSWVSERVMDRAAGEVRARRVETGAFEFINLHWTYEEVSGGVLMTWRNEFTMKPDSPYGDEQITANINREAPVEMGLIKKRVEARAMAMAENPVA